MSTDQLFSLLDEDEEDVELSLPPELQEELQTTIVYNLDWTVATILSQFADGVIDLQPQYQRRDAWSVSRKSKLIESLILGLPVPHIVLAERHDAKGTFLILDGKQRLTTLAQFSGNLPDSKLNGFALSDVPLLPHLEGVTYARMLETDSLRPTKNAFLSQPLRTAILRGWRSEDLLHLVFHRLNSQVVGIDLGALKTDMLALDEFGGRRGSLAHHPLSMWTTTDLPSVHVSSGIQAALSADRVTTAIQTSHSQIFSTPQRSKRRFRCGFASLLRRLARALD